MSPTHKAFGSREHRLPGLSSPTAKRLMDSRPQLADYTRDMLSINGKATAYVRKAHQRQRLMVCQNYSCKQPTIDVGKMLELFDEVRNAKTGGESDE